MSPRPKFKFRLYVAEGVQNSAEALGNLAELCRVYLPDAHEIEILDVFKEPRRALADHIFMTPTLMKLSPFPARRIVGTLSQTGPVLRALGLYDLPRPRQ
ncbi:MAG: putative thiol disulfide isomerase [Myxococcaceae bacterium]|nr:putative thiol disulfide isomerase [Myxococcaceae bacterium]